jgi:hypothetical protein
MEGRQLGNGLRDTSIPPFPTIRAVFSRGRAVLAQTAWSPSKMVRVRWPTSEGAFQIHYHGPPRDTGSEDAGARSPSL